MDEIVILGIGNILLSDEGFGVRVVECLQQEYRFPESVKVIDGGTLGLELLRFIKGKNKMILLDAMDGGKAPGTLYRLAGTDVDAYFREQVSLHELGVKDILADLELTGNKVTEVILIGIQPVSLELGLELTPKVADILKDAVGAVLEELKRWKVAVHGA